MIAAAQRTGFWLSLIRPGDWATALAGLFFCVASLPLIWQMAPPERAVVKRGGDVFAELDLARDRRIEVPGPLGLTIIVVEKRRLRVVSDPGPRQYCVKQGWLSRAGEIAICAPNQVSVQVVGSKTIYDSLSY